MEKILRSSFVWLGLCVLAFVNGAMREVVLTPLFGLSVSTAHAVSCVTGVVLWTVFTAWIWPFLKIQNFIQASIVGLGWLFVTFLFETFVIDRNLGWSQILSTYDVSIGQYWSLVLLWVGVMPVALFFILSFRHSINTPVRRS